VRTITVAHFTRARSAVRNQAVKIIQDIQRCLKTASSAVKWRWMLVGLLLSALSAWLGLPPLSSEYGEIPRLYLGTWHPASTHVNLETGYSFFEHAGSLRFRVIVRASLDFNDKDSLLDRKYPVDVRMIFPLGTICSASMENMPRGVTTIVKPLDTVESPGHLYPDLAAFELKGTDEKARMLCDVPRHPRHTTYSRRALELVVANPPPGTFWPGFARGESNQLILAEPDAEALKIDGHGEIDADRKLVQLEDVQQFTKWEWLDRRKETLGSIRLWASGALLGLGATALLEAVRRMLDGKPEQT